MLNVRPFFLAIIALPLVLVGCGDDGDGAAPTGSTSARGATKVWTYTAERYEGGPRVTPAALVETAAVVLRRGEALGQEIEAKVEGERVVISCAGGCTPPTAVGHLAFYDWEKHVRDARCRAAPADTSVTGGSSAGQPGAGSLSLYAAVVKTAAHCEATDEVDDTTANRWYGVDTREHAVLCGPRSSAKALRAACSAAGRRPSRSVVVPRGWAVVQAESDESDAASRALARDSYYILKDDPGLLGRDIKDPEQNTESQTGQPTVTFTFTDEGKKKWQKVTREIAQRGQAAVLPGQPATNFANHFAIVLDNKLISVPYIDPQQNPDGIDGENGSQISGSFTVSSARVLAATLRSGPLPLALTLVRR